MAKSSQQIEQEFIDSLKTTTGKDLKSWLSILKMEGIPKRNDMIKWLKETYNFGHMNASLLVGVYLNNGIPVYSSTTDLLEAQFEKCQEMRSLYNKLIKYLEDFDKNLTFVVKKTYVSITKKREIAAINIKRNELRLGFDLGDMPYDEDLTKSKLTGPMPRISHMLVIASELDLTSRIYQLLEVSDKRVNK